MIHVGVVGYGYWGPNLVRNFAESDGISVKGVSDLRGDRLSTVARRFPGVKTTTDYRELIEDPSIDAIAVATPVSSHFSIASEALAAGKHVLVEKPLASSSEQASQLIELAERKRRILMVDHTFVYTGAVRKIGEMIRNGDLGEIYYYDSVRINLGLFQSDVNVVWDLAVHDLSILEYVLPANPVAVAATGTRHIAGKAEDIAYLTMFFEDSLIAHIHVSWLAPVKVRRTLIGGSSKMIVYDDLEGDEKVKVYDKGVTLDNSPERQYQMRVNYRAGNMFSPQLDNTEALRLEVREFVASIESGRSPATDGHAGLRVVRILEAASKSIMERGRPVELQAKGATA